MSEQSASTFWPDDLPLRPMEGTDEETPGNPTFQEVNEVGPPNLRQRATAGVDTIACTYFVDKFQRATLDTFFKVTTKHGSLAFLGEHPSLGGQTTMNIVRLTYSPSGNAHYFARLVLLVQP